MVESVRTVAEAMQVYRRFLLDNGYISQSENIPHPILTPKGRENTVITAKLRKTLYVSSEEQFFWDFTQEAQKEQFGVKPEDKIPKGYAIRFNDGKYTYSASGDWQPNTYYVTKGSGILETNFATKEDALLWVQALVKQRSKSGKTSFVPPQLAHVHRTGPDYRQGQAVSGENYLETFGFRGGEFGNWLNQNDRQASLNMGFDALKDLAAALQISDKDIAYQGTLAIAFGARGKGNACAHYEPLRKVINLAKMHGAGSLAHEWWHSLDDYLGVKFGAKNFLSEQASLYPPMQQLMEAIKYKSETLEQTAERIERQNIRLKKEAESRLDAVLSALQNKNDGELLTQCAQLKEKFLNGQLGTVEKINTLKKSVTGRVIPKSDREHLLTYERFLHGMQEDHEQPKSLQPKRIATEYHQNSVKMGKDGGYWDSPVELTARAFACYILDKLPYTSDYLVGHAESARTVIYSRDGQQETITAYPVGEERKAINQAFDNLIAELKREKIFTHEEQTLPLEITLPTPQSQAQRNAETAIISSPSEAEPEQLSLFAKANDIQSESDKPSIKEQLLAAKQIIHNDADSKGKEHNLSKQITEASKGQQEH